MENENSMRDTLNSLFKLFVGITLSICAWNATRVVSDLDEMRKDTNQLKLDMMEVKTELKYIKNNK